MTMIEPIEPADEPEESDEEYKTIDFNDGMTTIFQKGKPSTWLSSDASVDLLDKV